MDVWGRTQNHIVQNQRSTCKGSHKKGGETMEALPKITPEMNLTCELMAEMERAEALLSEVRSTLDEINVTWAEVRAKLNQPTDGTDG